MRKFPNATKSVYLFCSSGEYFVPLKRNKYPPMTLGSGIKSRSLTFTKEIMVCLTIMIIQVTNTEITILLFRARISVTLPLIGPTGTVRINDNHQDGEVWSDDSY